jgi:hypothetical protein
MSSEVRRAYSEPNSSEVGAMRTAAVLAWIPGVGFGLFCPYAIWYLATRGQVWMVGGYPTYGLGPFEEIGIATSVPLLSLFLLVCLAEVAVGVLLWQRRRLGVVLGLAVLPLEFAFWIGFALPIGYLVGPARAAVLLVALLRRPGSATTAGT